MKDHSPDFNAKVMAIWLTIYVLGSSFNKEYIIIIAN